MLVAGASLVAPTLPPSHSLPPLWRQQPLLAFVFPPLCIGCVAA